MTAAAAAVLTLSVPGVSQTSLSAADSKFVREAAAGGAAEVELGKVAEEKATNEKVKEFGRRMVQDHSKAGDELKTLAAKKGVTVPSGPDAKSKAVMTKLSALSGPAFDKAYMKNMVADHEKDVAEFRKEANSGQDADIKQWAATTLPTLEEHLKIAKDAYGGVTGP